MAHPTSPAGTPRAVARPRKTPGLSAPSSSPLAVLTGMFRGGEIRVLSHSPVRVSAGGEWLCG